MFVPDVRAGNTPAGMNDRISPAHPVRITALVTNPPPAGQTILIEVDGGGPRTGEANIDGGASIRISGTTAFDVQGTTLTPEGSGPPHLQLGAWFANDLVGASNTFAVSVIQQDWSTAYDSQGEFPTGYDLYVEMRWDHDGAARYQLIGSHYVELVGVSSEAGAMRGMGAGSVQDPELEFGFAEAISAGDTHGTERRWLTGRGTQVLHQLWRTRDTRSGSDWVPSRNSGFVIERRYERDPDQPRCWRLSVEKAGRAVTIGGLSSGAGSGRASAVWRNINCDPPPPPSPGPEPQPPELPPQQPEPQSPEPPQPPPQPQPESECDRDELARRVDACIEQAREGAIECTADILWWAGPIITGGRYYLCLRRVRQELLECDRKAKEDTGCADGSRYA